ncbi:MAG: rod shape-determining protein RodA [Bacteroidales bacterium]|nr:rod shape-determining protein RodA [Bacteroidales bacterium]
MDMRERDSLFAGIDKITVLIYLALVLIGWISIYAAVYQEDHSSIFDISQNYGKQLIWIAIALFLAVIVVLVDIRFFPAFSYLIYIVVILLLIAVLFKGTVVAGSKSWFQIGGFALQPAELAKYATCLALARALSNDFFDMRTIKGKAIAFAIIGLPAILVLLQNDTGSALVFSSYLIAFYREGLSGYLFIAGFAVILLSVLTLLLGPALMIISVAVIAVVSILFIKRNRTNIVKVISIFLVAAAFIFTVEYSFENILQAHQKSRINVLLGKEIDLKGAGYNLNQSKIAIGSGGLKGKGFLQGTQTKYSFVPEQSTDFIFCTIGEEWGFIGSVIVIALYIILIIRLINMAERQRSDFARIYGYGVASVVTFHFIINIGMTIGLVPVIGIPLPFISYGGSSLMAFTLLLFTFVKQDAHRLDLL